ESLAVVVSRQVPDVQSLPADTPYRVP
ncbi:hypothetical protein A2U01_0112804, partial [Trifolium medium]|nr:hypothetical protein [Trifolium medium]